MQFLRQSTASQTRTLGPFVDDTDGKTAETSLTINASDIKLMANGAASVNKNSGGGTHRVNGMYAVTFNATDTSTVGELAVSVVVTGALPVWTKFFVLEEAVFDALFAASSAGPLTTLGTNAPANWINAAAIATAAITNAKFAASAIDAAAIASNAITSAKIAADAIGATQIAANAITSAKVAASAIGASQLADNAITAAKLAAASLNGKGDWAMAGAAMTLTSGERTTLAGVVDATLLNAGDATDLIASIVTRIGNTNVDQAAFVAAVKAALFDAASAANKLSVNASGEVTVSGGSGGLDAAGIRSAVGLSAANLETLIAAINTLAIAIKGKTDQLALDVDGRVTVGTASPDVIQSIATAVGTNVRTAAYTLAIDRTFLDEGEIRVKQRDDYAAVDGRAFEATISIPGVDFTTATAVAGAGQTPGAPVIVPTVSLHDKTVGSCTLRLEFPSASLDVDPGTYFWDAHIVIAGRRNTVVDGTILVEPKYADAP